MIGPYGHFDAQRGVVSAPEDTTIMISGYEIDLVARIEMVAELRYPWFDCPEERAQASPARRWDQQSGRRGQSVESGAIHLGDGKRRFASI